MIDHQIRHEFVLFADRLDIFPVTQCRVDLQVIHDRKAVVRAEREEGQYVDGIDYAIEIVIQKAMQGVQRLLGVILYGVAIGDQHAVFFAPVIAVRYWRLEIAPHADLFGEPLDQWVDGLVRIDEEKVFADAASELLFQNGLLVFHRLIASRTPENPLRRQFLTDQECPGWR